ncbi:MAG: hypothetical protein ACI9WT_001765, partial [Flavobacterium sp.]
FSTENYIENKKFFKKWFSIHFLFHFSTQKILKLTFLIIAHDDAIKIKFNYAE